MKIINNSHIISGISGNYPDTPDIMWESYLFSVLTEHLRHGKVRDNVHSGTNTNDFAKI